jgi:predicted MPP superfamily phosphohydrolase
MRKEVKEKEKKHKHEKEAIHIADLHSLGVHTKRKTELNDEKELAELADNIKQSMIHDYKVAYSKKGDELEEEAKSTIRNP